MEAVILIGIQGAGKSTFYRERFFDTHVRISLDLLRTRARELALVEACLRTGQRFLVDNTNVRVAERAVYLEAAMKRLERPKREEGFDELYLVTRDEAGAFVVEKWS